MISVLVDQRQTVPSRSFGNETASASYEIATSLFLGSVQYTLFMPAWFVTGAFGTAFTPFQILNSHGKRCVTGVYLGSGGVLDSSLFVPLIPV